MNQELNNKSIETVNNLKSSGYFENLRIIDNLIKNNQNPLDREFYLQQQDQVNEIYGEFLNSYYELKGELKKYLAIRKFELRVEAEDNKKRVPGNEALEAIVLAEIGELYKATIVLEGWVERALNTLRTCRNHGYIVDREDKVE